MRGGTPEGALVGAVLTYLRLRGVFAWRNNTGGAMLPGRGGQLRPVKFGLTGLPDVLGVRKVTPLCPRCGAPTQSIGQLIGVECKRATRVSREQRATLAALEEQRALVVVARAITDVEKAL